MQLIFEPQRLSPSVVVLGMFDGVHRGHQALLQRGNALADEVGLPLTVCTFEPHPLAVLAPDQMPPRLTTPAERARLMAAYGVERLCVHRFTRAMADLPPEDFLSAMVEIYQPAALVCGFNFTFGRRGEGNGELLKRYAAAHGIRAEVVPEVRLAGDTVSSTRIRRLLQSGELPTAIQLLGHAWTLSGQVVNGKHLGRRLGYPTANIQPPKHKALPAFGVYCCYLTTEEGIYPAVVNIGAHPTLPGGGVTVEAHLLEGDPDLYGQRVRLQPMRYLRPEQRFPDPQALTRQIQSDILAAQACFDIRL